SLAHAQPDSVRAKILKKKGFPPTHSPRRALWRAAAVPGWGQLYNRQYYKIPFVYAGLGGGGYAIYEMNRRYLLYRHANLYKVGQNRKGEGSGGNPYRHFKDEYERVVAQLGGQRVGGRVSGRQLRKLRDTYRRWRDLSILGTGLFYALTVLDAYVSAHLLVVEVGSVAVKVRPTGRAQGRRIAGKRGGRPSWSASLLPPNGVGVRVRVQF
ncbi:MAG: DUF5683 domain-containing protein, partial [Salinibacter sp.]